MNQKYPQRNNHNIIVQQEQFSGPLPHPSILKQYNDIVPDAAERILKKFEAQSEHRQFLEKTVVRADIKKSYIGMILGALIALVTIVGGFYLALQGIAVGGIFTALTGLGYLVALFVKGNVVPKK